MCYTSTSKLCTLYMDIGEIQLKLAEKRAASDLCIGITSAVMALVTAGNKDPYLPITRGHRLLTGPDSPYQTCSNDFEVRAGQSPGFYVPASGSETIWLLVCLALHTYVHYSTAEEKNLVELLCM